MPNSSFLFLQPPLVLRSSQQPWSQLSQAEWLVPLPEGLSEIDAMTIGTAGFTAALCVKALEDAVTPENELPKLTHKKIR